LTYNNGFIKKVFLLFQQLVVHILNASPGHNNNLLKVIDDIGMMQTIEVIAKSC